MVRAMREANHGRMREAELASRMRRNRADSNRGARSRGRRNPAMESFRHDRVLLEKQEIGLSRGNVTVEKREQGRRGKNRMASLLDLSRRDLRARDSNLLANGLLKRDRPTANRELRERSPGRRRARVRGLAAQNLTKRDPLASRSPKLAARSRGRSDPAASDGEGSAPKRRDRKETAGTGPREKSGAKPFWAKNPRGGKGSTAAGRSNRPQGKHAARKSGKKK